jgi:hypothetical protein
MLTLTLSLALVLTPLPMATADAALVGGVSGTVVTDTGERVSGQLARLRHLDGGAIAGMTTTGPSGTFLFANVPAGRYIVEVVASGYILGTSAPIALGGRDSIVEGVPVVINTKSPEFVSFLGAGGFWRTTGGYILSSAIVAGIVTAAIIAARGDASPSR